MSSVGSGRLRAGDTRPRAGNGTSWPQEGHVQSFWRNPEIPVTQKDKYRLPKVGGKQHVNFHPRRVRKANEADLRWISQAYGRERVASSPQSAT